MAEAAVEAAAVDAVAERPIAALVGAFNEDSDLRLIARQACLRAGFLVLEPEDMAVSVEDLPGTDGHSPHLVPDLVRVADIVVHVFGASAENRDFDIWTVERDPAVAEEEQILLETSCARAIEWGIPIILSSYAPMDSLVPPKERDRYVKELSRTHKDRFKGTPFISFGSPAALAKILGRELPRSANDVRRSALEDRVPESEMTFVQSAMAQAEKAFEEFHGSSETTVEQSEGAFEEPAEPSIDTTPRYIRHASEEELTDWVKTYADGMARVLRNAEDEVCFGIFGRWGFGKTHLARLIGERLSHPPEETMPRYDTVTFSAWTYPTPPQNWIFLYETFRRALVKDRKTSTLAARIRSHVLQHGLLPVAGALILFGALILPTGEKLLPFLTAVGVASAGTLAYFLRIWSASHTIFNKNWGALTRFASHTDKLGLQETIGADLKWLLVSWMPVAWQPRQPGDGRTDPIDDPATELYEHVARDRWGWVTLAFAILFVGWAQGPFAKPAFVDENGLSVAFHWLSPDPAQAPLLFEFSLVILVLWLVVAFLAYFWLFRQFRRPETIRQRHHASDRILLCIDDLDRCDPDQLLQTIESLKLFLENPVVAHRLQVLFLVDQDILNHAICDKFKKYAAYRHAVHDTPNKADAETRDRKVPVHDPFIVTEHLEKLFLAWFSLPPLSPHEAEEIAGRHLARHGLPEVEITEETAIEADGASSETRVVRADIRHRTADGRTATRRITRSVERNQSVGAAFSSRTTNDSIVSEVTKMESRTQTRTEPTEEEQDAVQGDLGLAGTYTAVEQDVLRETVRAHEREFGWSPRGIRSFMFKYQMARELLKLTGTECPPEKLASALCGALDEARSGDSKPVLDEDGLDRHSVEGIVRLVV